ncbi:hypothetical protein RRG08_003724 [Elysia crispata]|uniref:Uncharacterized protein n=1 Tax=Elysia crispata TaxID=231223 RepID=A0AAE1AVL5_9GAST|nr:hypothetical protein RRG08_003724 [Elysia crispata]
MLSLTALHVVVVPVGRPIVAVLEQGDQTGTRSLSNNENTGHLDLLLLLSQQCERYIIRQIVIGEAGEDTRLGVDVYQNLETACCDREVNGATLFRTSVRQENTVWWRTYPDGSSSTQ